MTRARAPREAGAAEALHVRRAVGKIKTQI